MNQIKRGQNLTPAENKRYLSLVNQIKRGLVSPAKPVKFPSSGFFRSGISPRIREGGGIPTSGFFRRNGGGIPSSGFFRSGISPRIRGRNVNVGFTPRIREGRNVGFTPRIGEGYQRSGEQNANVGFTPNIEEKRERNANVGFIPKIGEKRGRNANFGFAPNIRDEGKRNANVGFAPNIKGSSSIKGKTPSEIFKSPNRIGFIPPIKGQRGQLKTVGRKYVHHQHKGSLIFPGVKVKVLKKSIHLLKKKRIQNILGNKRNLRKQYFEKKLLKQIRPKKKEKSAHVYKETKR